MGTPVVALPQVLRPTSDVAAGGWTPSTGASLYGVLNETSADDGDYIQSGDNPNADLCEVALTAASDPHASSGYIVQYRVYKDGTATAALLFRLMEGAVQRATWTVSDVPSTPTTGAYELTTAEVDSIGDHADLRVQMEATVA